MSAVKLLLKFLVFGAMLFWVGRMVISESGRIAQSMVLEMVRPEALRDSVVADIPASVRWAIPLVGRAALRDTAALHGLLARPEVQSLIQKHTNR